MRPSWATIRRPLTYGSVVICLLTVTAWLIVIVGRSREDARSSQCAGPLKQLGLALLNYESAYGCLPPAYVVDANGKCRKLTDIRDDPKSTLMLVESNNSGVHWMEPRDLDWDQMSFCVNERSRPSISSEHRVGSYPGPHVLSAEDGVGYLPDDISADTIRSLLTIDDGRALQFTAGPRKE